MVAGENYYMENKVYQKPELKIYEVEIANLLSVSNPTGETDPWEEASKRGAIENDNLYED